MVTKKKVVELTIAEIEKQNRADELVIANQEKAKRIAELVIANEEKAIQEAGIIIADEEKAKRVAELVIANEEKQKRADELVIAEEEKQKQFARILIADGEKAKRVAELVIANDEKQKRLAELVISNYELQQSLQLNADKDLFISIMAHDLRSPFNALLGLSDLLIDNLRKYNMDEIEELVNHIKSSAQGTYSLLEDLLKWTRAQSGNIPYNPQKLNIEKVCKDILGSFDTTASAKKITTSLLVKSNISVFSDPDMLNTVLRNLITNAIKFTNTGGLIEINAEETPENIIVSISDNGIGMSLEKMKKLFDISQIQTSSSGTANEKGTGFGLLLCKEFVEKHGGKIWVESRSGEGSDFKFSLPVNKESVLNSQSR